MLFGHAHGRRFAGCVGEESERETSRAEFSDSGAVTEKGGRVSGVGVAQCSELLVVTGNEGRTGVDTADTSISLRLM